MIGYRAHSCLHPLAESISCIILFSCNFTLILTLLYIPLIAFMNLADAPLDQGLHPNKQQT